MGWREFSSTQVLLVLFLRTQPPCSNPSSKARPPISLTFVPPLFLATCRMQVPPPIVTTKILSMVAHISRATSNSSPTTRTTTTTPTLVVGQRFRPPTVSPWQTTATRIMWWQLVGSAASGSSRQIAWLSALSSRPFKMTLPQHRPLCHILIPPAACRHPSLLVLNPLPVLGPFKTLFSPLSLPEAVPITHLHQQLSRLNVLSQQHRNTLSKNSEIRRLRRSIPT
jgi:hypothetical protein